MELTFRLKQIEALNLRGIPPLEAWRFLSREVHRRPRALVLHLGRIRAASALDAEAVYAALLDLMTVLENKGTALRWRVFRQMRSRLNEARAADLYRYLNDKIPLSQLPFSPRSVLQQGVVGRITSAAGKSPSGSGGT